MESTTEIVSKKSVAENLECAEEVPEKAKDGKLSSGKEEAEVTVTVRRHVEDKNVNAEANVKEKQQVEASEPNSTQPKSEQVIEDVEENEEDEVEIEESCIKKVAEDIENKPNGGKTKAIITETIDKKKLTADSTQTIVTTSIVTNENHPSGVCIKNSGPTIKEVKMQTAEVEKSNKDISSFGEKQVETIQDKEEQYDEQETEEKDNEEDHGANNLVSDEMKKTEDPSEQQLTKDQVSAEAESQEEKQTPTKEETVIDAPSVVDPQTKNNIPTKQDNLNNAIKDIISSIDSNIRAEESIAALKERELELLQQQQELAMEIEQQKLLAQELAHENQLKQLQINHNNSLSNQESNISTKIFQPSSNVSKYATFEEKQDNNVYSRKSEMFESRESTNVSKKIDLHKIFTPATDAEEILPKNRKLYASSAFYSSTLHPTVEDQVELARRISHSLSDSNNQQSRGQSMYVNRKKRSVKWVHEGCGEDATKNVNNTNEEEYDEEEKENDVNHHEKVPLKFLMNPFGKIRDINSLRDSLNTETGLLSPDISAEVVTALQAQKGKGAELFAKRRKVSEKWIVDESNVGAQSPSGLPDYHQYQQQPKPPTSPSILPAYTDAAKHRVQLNLHQEQVLEKYAKAGLRVVQTPWEAALHSGSASAAFVEEQKLSPYPASMLTTPQIFDASQESPLQASAIVSDGNNKIYSSDDYQRYQTHAVPQTQAQYERQYYTGSNLQRELAYKPSIPQGWKGPSMSLPKDLYMPKEIPLQSYAPPPVTALPSPFSRFSSNNLNTYNIPIGSSPVEPNLLSESAPGITKPSGGSSTFPTSKPYQSGFSSAYGNSQPPKQQYLPPDSYQKISQNNSQNIPHVSFNPSALPYNKLAKFENPPADEGRYISSPMSFASSHLNMRNSRVRNTSPAPFATSYSRPYIPSPDKYYYRGTPSVSPRPQSSTHQYSGHNTPSVTSNTILNVPSYNKTARGWGCSGGVSTRYQNPPANKSQIVNAASMPYTDF